MTQAKETRAELLAKLEQQIADAVPATTPPEKLNGHTRPTDVVEPLFDYRHAKHITHSMRTPAKPLRYLVDGMIERGIVHLVVAPPGTGKTYTLLDLAFGVAGEADQWLGWGIKEHCEVLYLLGEESTRSNGRLHHRLEKLTKKFGTPIPERLTCWKEYSDCTLTRRGDESEWVRNSRVVDGLLSTIEQHTVGLLIIDPIRRFRNDENSNIEATRFVQALEYIAETANVAVVCAHHTVKNAKLSSQDAAAGGGAITAAVRAQYHLIPMSEAQGAQLGVSESQRASCVRLHSAMVNDAATVDRWLERYTDETGLGGVFEAAEYLTDSNVQKRRPGPPSALSDDDIRRELLRLIGKYPGMTSNKLQEDIKADKKRVQKVGMMLKKERTIVPFASPSGHKGWALAEDESGVEESDIPY